MSTGGGVCSVGRVLGVVRVVTHDICLGNAGLMAGLA
jgi:hypothetical protein